MLAFDQQPSCSCPESLVLIEMMPLCRIFEERFAKGDIPDEIPLSDYEVDEEEYPRRALRCAAVMTCADAFSLLEEAGYVEW